MIHRRHWNPGCAGVASFANVSTGDMRCRLTGGNNGIVAA
jgi:hypothetical protein